MIKWESLNDIVLVGHSYGGAVVSGVAEQVPEAIGRFVFLDAFGPADPSPGRLLMRQTACVWRS